MNEIEKAAVMLHGWNSSAMTKLQDILDKRYAEVIGDSDDPDEDWILFLNGIDCSVLSMEHIVENFPDIMNFDSSVRNGVCLHDPHGYENGITSYVFMPRDLAEKILVLGDLP